MTTFDALKKAFMAQKGNPLHLTCKKIDYLYLKYFLSSCLNYEDEAYLRQSLSTSQHKNIIAYHTPDHRLPLTLVTGQLSQSMQTTNCLAFAFTLKLKSRHTLYWIFLIFFKTPLERRLFIYFSILH